MSRVVPLIALAGLYLLLALNDAYAQSALGAPSIESVSAGTDSLTVVWSTPGGGDGATITAYDLRYILSSASNKADDHWTLKEDIWSSGITLYQLTDLSEDTSYDIQVRAANSNDDGPWSGTFVRATTDLSDSCLGFDDTYDDPLFGCQWYLKNTGQYGGAGQDINVESAWQITRGSGINVAIVDDGLHSDHPDLSANVDTSRNHDYHGHGVFNPAASHGTNVAGVIAAADNEHGGRGVAPDATIYAYNLNGDPSHLVGPWHAMIRDLNDTAVSNNSWGDSDDGRHLYRADVWESNIERGLTQGFGGKGISYVMSGGNGAQQTDDSNLNGRANHYGVIAVCAVDYNDTRSYYSEKGANLWVCAPSSGGTGAPWIWTTENGGYTTFFGGTSAAAAVVSGVVALMRAANLELTWRDVKLILAASARKNDATNAGWEQGATKYGGSGNYNFNHEYGFGVVDAGAAVSLAVDWTSVPALRKSTATSDGAPLSIPDAPDTGSPITVSQSLSVDNYVGFVEFVAVEIDIEHDSFRNLEIELVSPSGEVSRLARKGQGHIPHQGSFLTVQTPINGTLDLAAAKHLGEDPAGNWTLRITDRDHRYDDTGRLRSWSLTVYGHGHSPGYPEIDNVTSGDRFLTVGWSAPDDTGGSNITSYDLRHVRSDPEDKSDSEWTLAAGIATTDADPYDLTGLRAGVEYDLQIRAINDTGAGPWSESFSGTTTDAVPTAPVITTVTAQSRELDVAWTSPPDLEVQDIISYDLRYIRSDATDRHDNQWTVIDSAWTSGDLQHTVTGLVNGTRYDLQVRAVSTEGNMQWSATATAAPYTRPDSPTIESVTPGNQNLIIRWAASPSDGGSAVTTYDVRHIRSDATDKGDASWTVNEDVWTGGALEYSVAGIVTRVLYDIQMRAVNASGAGPWSTTMTGILSNTPSTGAPSISGTARAGETLTADTSAIDDADGLVNVAYSYQWLRNDGNDDAEIAGANGETYTLAPDDEGKTIKVRVSFTDNADNEETLTSAATAAVAAANTAATGQPTIDGTVQVDQTLTADTSGITDEDGLINVSYSYQWIRNDGGADAEIAGANGETYTLAPDDEGKTIKVRVSFTDNADNEETLTSAATAVVAAANTPATGQPTIDGTVQVGKTLTADTSAIDDADGLVNVAYSYQWLRNDGSADAEIAGANGETYTLAPDDEGKTIKVRVSFTDNADNEETLTSAATAAVAAANTAATGQPTIDGTVQVGKTLTADTSAIDDADGLVNVAYSYQWLRNDGNDDAEIAGANGETYTLAPDDEGKTIKVRVSFTDNADNEETLTSAATAAVAAKPNTAEEEAPVWSADMLVVEYTSVSIGAASADLFSNVGGSAGLPIKSLWSYTPDRDLRLEFKEAVPGAAELTLQVGDLALEFPAGSSGQSSFKWKDVDVDWKDGQTISVRIIPTPATEAPQPNSPATALPSINGTAQAGQTLTADVSGIEDADGRENAEFSYQWIRNDGTTDTDIQDATASTYTPSVSEVGKTIKVRVNFTDDADNQESLTSAATTEVAATVPTEPLSLTVTSGDQDQELDASWQVPSSDGGSAITGYKVQWKEAAGSWDTEADVSEETATGTTYTITGLTGGVEYAVRILATNEVGDGPASAEATGTPAGDTSQQNSEPTGLPTISGTAQAGQILTADTTGIDDDDGLTNVSYSYQWIRSDGNTDSDIQDATSSTYTLSDDDVGKTIKVRVSFTDNRGNGESLTSAATAPVEEAPQLPLTASTHGVPQSHDGENVFTFELRFSEELKPDFSFKTLKFHAFTVNGGEIRRAKRLEGSGNLRWTIHVQPDGNGSVTIVLPVTTDCDAEHAICAEDGRPLSNHLEITVSGPQDAAQNSPATGLPTISGTAQAGQTLTADTSGIGDQDGLTNPAYSYQWVSNDGNADADIAGETASTYEVSNDDVGKTIKVRVTFTDDANNGETLTSAATNTVVAPPNTPATGAPTISGTAQAGQTLTADTSGIGDQDGLTNPGYSYQWVSNDGNADADIAGETASTYEVSNDDVGKTIKVRVTFTDDANNGETLTSELTAAVVARPNSPATGLPTISGTAQAGQTLTADTSGIDDEDGLTNVSYSYQWIRSDGNTDMDIDGATASTYQVSDDDVGNTIRVRVRFTDDRGNSESLTSEPTAEVTGPVVWSAILTVGISGNNLGYSVFTDAGALSPEEFSLDGSTRSVKVLVIGDDGLLSFGLDEALETAFTLHVGGISFLSEDASPLPGPSAHTYQWDRETLAWAVDDEVVVSLTTDNNPATGTPTISGNAQAGQTLTADTSGIIDEDGLTSPIYSYQWIRNDGNTDTDIDGATDSTYELTDHEVGQTIKVRVSFTDDRDNQESLTSEATAAVAARPNTPATGLPTISGTAQAGQTLTADTSGIDDEDGLTGVSYSYQWLADDAGIQAATSSTYELTDDEVGKTIKVRVSFTDDRNNQESLTSAATAEVAPQPGNAEEQDVIWSADMLVVEITSVSIGADRAELFSNIGGTAGLQIKSLWSHTPSRDLCLAFEEGVPDAEDLTLIVGDLSLEFPAWSSGERSFKWKEVDIDWEIGETVSVRIIPTS